MAGTLGPERGDLQAALIAAVMNGLWSKKRRKLKDFLFRWDQGREMGTEEMLARLRVINRLAGGEEVVRER